MDNQFRNISLGLNVILVVAVGILYYLHFSGKKPGSGIKELNDTSSAVLPLDMPPINTGASSKVVFINYDSLIANYEFSKKIEKDMEGKMKNMENELMTKQQKLESDLKFYQESGEKMTEQHRAAKEQQLMEDDKNIKELYQRRSEQLANQEKEMNDALLNNLYTSFDRLARQNNFDYILTYKKGVPGVVFGKDSLDITREIVESLNQEYTAKRKK